MTKRRRDAYRTSAAVLVASCVLAGSQSLASAQVAITPEQAAAAALAAVPGTVVEVELENERETVLYEVEIRPASGGRVVEVMVDPATGAVLSSVMDDDDGPVGSSNGSGSDD